MQDSNLQLSGYEPPALPFELIAHIPSFYVRRLETMAGEARAVGRLRFWRPLFSLLNYSPMAEAEGFEPSDLAASCFQDRCLKPLGHASIRRLPAVSISRGHHVIRSEHGTVAEIVGFEPTRHKP